MITAVYLIQNTHNNRGYIGSARDAKRRLMQHKNLLLKQKHHNKQLQADFTAFGEGAFTFCITEEVPVEELRSKEHQAIVKADRAELYNSTSETRTPFDDPLIRAKAIAARNNNPQWREFIVKNGNANAHILRRPDVQEKRISALRSSAKHKAAHVLRKAALASPEVRKLKAEGMRKSTKIRAILDRIRADANAACRKRIEGTNVSTGEVRLFSAVTEAVTFTGGLQGNIARAARDTVRKRVSYGWTWRYV